MNEHLDHALVNELRELMDDDFASLFEMYLQDSEQQFHDVSDAWEDGDLDRLRRSAHSLKGASSNVGAVALAKLCADLEAMAVEGRTAQVSVTINELRAELCEVRDAVTALNHVR